MKYLNDRIVERLKEVSDYPDLGESKYRLLSRLGRGGMGTVYLVEDGELGREVALKVLSDPDPSVELSTRLLKEARHLAQLEHPNIVPVHDVGELPDGRVFYVMKYIRGERLDRWLETEPSRPAQLRMFQRICEAVAFAHDRGVVHRDLKPENIMVGSFGEAVVMDWGVAKALRRGDDAGTPEPAGSAAAPEGGDTAHGVVMGTPAYMAPEQARGEVGRIDERTDVYALGALLYFVLSGGPPGDTRVDTLEAGAGRWSAPAALRRVDPTIPRSLESICRMAMAENPEDRYGGAQQMARDIESYLDDLPVAAHPENLLEKAGRLLKRYQLFVLLILAYLLMRLALIFFTGP